MKEVKKTKKCGMCKKVLPLSVFRMAKRVTYKTVKTGETKVYYYLRHVCKKCQCLIIIEYNKRNPFKNNARIATRNAVMRGELKKLPCVICGELKVEGHHEDYNKPLEIVWLCPPHHRLVTQKKLILTQKTCQKS